MPEIAEVREKSDEEIKKLALDMMAGRVFTSLHIREGEEARMLPSIFMPLVFIGGSEDGEALIEKLKSGEITLIYEYLSEAGPRAINGYPSFLSMRCLNRADHKALSEMLNKLQTAIDAVE